MAKIGQPYTSGHWLVKEGNQDEFVKRWTEFTEWAFENASGAESFLLIQDDADRRHFISFGAWEDKGSVDAWRGSQGFAEHLGRCRELCDEFRGTDFRLVAAVGA